MRWLAGAPSSRSVTVIATATACDDEMQARIARHRADRPQGFGTVEAPLALGEALRQASATQNLLIVDCLTLWVCNVLMGDAPEAWPALKADLLSALSQAPGPVVLVSNEVGWGVVPMGAEVRHYVDELGRLHQDVAQRCGEITLMAAGQAWTKPVEVWS